MKISVLICSRNRAASLRSTLEAVFNQVVSENYDFEVVVVDNASTDATRLTVAAFISALPAQHFGRLRYCYEARPGLSNARNAALGLAQGDILAFIDDDILPDASWLDELSREFNTDSTLCLLGGRVLLAKDNLQPIGIITSKQRRHFTTPDCSALVIGANLAFRRELVAKIGGFDPRLGTGSTFAAGEDVDFVYRAMKAGYQLLYAPTVTVYHNHHRQTHAQACQLEYSSGNGAVAYFMKHVLKADWFALKVAYWSLLKAMKHALGLTPVPPDVSDRSRAYLRGVIKGVVPALVRMW
ncbi:MAG: glycosyltransferase family 2 protein [Blastocatellia bacterium]|nr:glycosyltransferase family 2 protein [Blastocatellia bacterium]